MSLYVYVPDHALRDAMSVHLNNRRWSDSGFDLLSPYTILAFNTSRIGVEMKLGAHFAALDEQGNPVPYLLLARSSTSLTPLRMSNQIGLADAGYRGELIARVDCLENDMTYTVEFGRRLFQVVQHNWLPWKKIVLVDSLNDLPAAPDNRGAGGFGSTGN
jgi:dUTP pyrophosphatase